MGNGLGFAYCRYQLQPGVCSKSYGLNVANMAGLPCEIVDRADKKAAELEASCKGTALGASLTRDTAILRRLCGMLDVNPTLPQDRCDLLGTSISHAQPNP